MEQMYLLEIFIDKLTMFLKKEEDVKDKFLVIRTAFGPIQFIIKEGQLVVGKARGKDVVEVTPGGRRQYSRTFRVGKSYLFPSYPETVLGMLEQYPILIDVWSDDDSDPDYKLYIGVAAMYWHTKFFNYIRDTTNTCLAHDSLSFKDIVTLYQECCCEKAGEISLIIRLSALGATIISEFQQMMDDPEIFCFKNNKMPGMYQCKRIEADNPEFCTAGSLYDTVILEDPEMLKSGEMHFEVCTGLQSCAIEAPTGKYVCHDPATEDEVPEGKKLTIDKIKMGDITGPCGNKTCPLAHQVRQYIRHLDTYRTKAGKISENKPEGAHSICGTCICKDDHGNKENYEKLESKVVCSGCGGKVFPGETCNDRKDNFFGTGATPKPTPQPSRKNSKLNIHCVTKVPDYKDIFKRNYIVQNCSCMKKLNSQENKNCTASTSRAPATAVPSSVGGCCCGKVPACNLNNNPRETQIPPDLYVYNAEISHDKKQVKVFNVCTEIAEDKDCRCTPPKPSPPCKTFDCNCIPELVNKALRRAHRPYCPLYSHKTNCPVTMRNVEEGEKKEDEEDETEPLPYGLPPIRLGPCPVMGRPCSVADGFARMYKTAVMPTQPPSYSDAGKVCCSKEFERIKSAIKQYMKYQKDHDMRCINRYNVDTERRCCDKEQFLLSLMGRQCCGIHKLAIQEEYKEEKK